MCVRRVCESYCIFFIVTSHGVVFFSIPYFLNEYKSFIYAAFLTELIVICKAAGGGLPRRYSCMSAAFHCKILVSVVHACLFIFYCLRSKRHVIVTPQTLSLERILYKEQNLFVFVSSSASFSSQCGSTNTARLGVVQPASVIASQVFFYEDQTELAAL